MIDYTNYFWQGNFVRLRGVREEDAEQVYIARLDTPARQLLQLETELPTSPEQIRENLVKRANCQDFNGVILFAFETLQSELAGVVSYHTRDLKNGTFSFGVFTYSPHRQRGYAEDAVRILLKYAFWEQRFQKCNSACIATNQASIRLHQKLGFLEEGRRRRNLFYNGEYHDELLFGLTREEFDATRF